MKLWLFTISLLVFVAPCNAQNKKNNETIEGKWFLDIQHNSTGSVRTFMEFNTHNGSFEAFTRKKADRDILGYWRSTLGRVFTKNFKKGSFVRIKNGVQKVENDTLKLTGIFCSPLIQCNFNGYVIDNKLYAELTGNTKKRVGVIRGEKKQMPLPLDDYSDLFERIIKLTDKKIYNRDLLQSKEWKSFTKNMRTVCPKVQDDLEMIFAFKYYAGKLPISHYSLSKEHKDAASVSKKLKQYVFLEEKSDETAYLKISSFSGSSTEMDSVFCIINNKSYKNLIVDLRNNYGGSVAAAMAFATSVVSDTSYGGVFLTQKWFNKHQQLPTVEEYQNLPHFTEANFNMIIDGIRNTEALCLKIIPKQSVYSGNMYILTNAYTASACEPIVYELKQQKRAIVVGEKTAGAMLSGETFKLDSGFKIFLPTADYYASDGFRIDQNGVIPNIEVKQEEALEYVLKKLIHRKEPSKTSNYND